MAGSPSTTPVDSSDNSTPSNTTPTQHVNIGGIKHTKKPPTNVKFTMGDDEDELDPDDVKDPSPVRIPSPPPGPSTSQDIGDLTLTPSANAWQGRTSAAAAHAQSRASRLADRLSNPGSRRTSATATPIKQHQGQPDIYSPGPSPPLKPVSNIKMDDIPLAPIEKDRRPYTVDEDTTDDETTDSDAPKVPKRENENMQEARRLVRQLTGAPQFRHTDWQGHRSGTETPAADKHLYDIDYIPEPQQYKPSVLGALVSSNLVDWQRRGAPRRHDSDEHHPSKGSRRPSGTEGSSEQSSGTTTPQRKRKWYENEKNSDPPSRTHSTGSLSHLLSASLAGASMGRPGASEVIRPGVRRNKSSGSLISTAVEKIRHTPAKAHNHIKSRLDIGREEEDIATTDIAEILAARKYLKKLAKALMGVGAPSHRLEEYMKTSARALRVDADFLYLPGSMIISLNDPVLMNTEVTLVRESRGVNLGRFKDVFDVYKCVIHHVTTPEEALQEIDDIMTAKPMYKTIYRVLAFGFAAICVGPFAFSARPVDFGPSFILGCALGFLQLVVVPRSDQFRHVFEVFASVMLSFASRGIGSILKHNNEPVFCFSAITQSSIALILPGFIILTAALDLQGANLISGAVGMVYAIIYSLFLGFGILIGTTIFGLIDKHATNEVTCQIPDWWSSAVAGHKNPNWHVIYTQMIWVPGFAAMLCIVNQAKPRQMPMMILIAVIGWQANYWVGLHVQNNIQVANAIGAFAVGVVANFYSRFFHGLAAAAMLPAIFVQVPSGLAASGSLVAGITSANQITGNSTGISVINNGTAGFLSAQNATTGSDLYGGTIFNVGYGMVQVAIGISVGLYLSALVVYPYGKRRSGLFSF